MRKGATLTEIAYPGATLTVVSKLNNQGQIAGTYVDNNGANHGFVYDSTKAAYYTIDFPGAASTALNAIGENETLVGVPSFSVPVPLSSGALPIPELALYKKSDQEGVAKFTATAYEAKSGKHLADAEPQFGHAHDMKQTVLFFVTWTSNDIYPKDDSGLLPSP